MVNFGSSSSSVKWLDSARAKILQLVSSASQNEPGTFSKIKYFCKFSNIKFNIFFKSDKKNFMSQLSYEKILGSARLEPIFFWLDLARADIFKSAFWLGSARAGFLSNALWLGSARAGKKPARPTPSLQSIFYKYFF